MGLALANLDASDSAMTAGARELDDNVNNIARVVDDICAREVGPGLKRHECDLIEGAARAIGMHRRHRARVAGVDSAQE